MAYCVGVFGCGQLKIGREVAMASSLTKEFT